MCAPATSHHDVAQSGLVITRHDSAPPRGQAQGHTFLHKGTTGLLTSNVKVPSMLSRPGQLRLHCSPSRSAHVLRHTALCSESPIEGFSEGVALTGVQTSSNLVVSPECVRIPLWFPETSMTLTTDASITGWGALGSRTF